MRNPNGYGAIIKLGGKRRKPFAIRLTAGYTDEGKQEFKYLSYHETRPEAMIALAEYNKNPFDITKAGTTFAQVYEQMMKVRYPNGYPKHGDKEYSNYNGYNSSYKSSEKLYDKKFADLRTKDLQEVMDGLNRSHGTKRKLKVLFNQMYKYAMMNDLVTKDYSEFVDVGKNDKGTFKKPFTDVEIKTLWDNVEPIAFIEWILILIYTGLRPGELVELKNADINIDERYLRGGFKTDAGTNRLIPINEKILPFIKKHVSDHEYLVLNSKGDRMTYSNFKREYFDKVMDELGMQHNPHECRHTFATLMDNADANKLSIKRIMGHASKDITDKVYTHKDVTQLTAAIDLI